MLLTGLTLGLALAMDAFCVSFADSMARPDMNHRQLFLIALVFGVFQTIMPLIGSLLIRFVDDSISAVHPYIKYVAAAVFAFLAFNMLRSAITNESESFAVNSFGTLLLQGIGTSIDAFSAGFSFYDKPFTESLLISLIIGVVTFVLCIAALFAGRKAGSVIPRIAKYVGAAIFIFLCIKQLAGF